jgi:hypothetical protein
MGDNRLTFVLLLVFGSILLIISEFVSVFRGYNNIELIFNNPIFIFPLISGVMSIISSGLIYTSKIRNPNKNLYIFALILLIGALMINMQYIIFLLSNHAPNIWSFPSIYLNFLGFLISLLGLFVILTIED